MWNRLDRDGKVSVLWYVLIFVGLGVWGLGFGKLEVGEWLAFVVLLGLNITGEFNEAAARTGLRQAQADREKAEAECKEVEERLIVVEQIAHGLIRNRSTKDRIFVENRWGAYRRKYNV
ncbi:MAG TPA: hypothetical protein VK175_06065 [Leadbetterella sp.]|nr:hypothetical protein [Leadbetterella sp.]